MGNEIEDNHRNDDVFPPLFLWDDNILVCQGATLPSFDTDAAETVTTTVATGASLSVCGSVSDVLLIEGITMGDLETSNGILNTRHARTLSFLFQSKKQRIEPSKKQTLVFVISTTSDSDAIDEEKLIDDIRTLYQVENLGSKDKMDDAYKIQIIPVSSSSSGSKVCGILGFVVSFRSFETLFVSHIASPHCTLLLDFIGYDQYSSIRSFSRRGKAITVNYP